MSLQHPEIVVPERKIIRVPDELKNDIKVVTHSLVDKVALRPEILQEITPRQFEELVCELFERKGYNVQLTDPSPIAWTHQTKGILSFS